ncbi:MAG TPA: hypothetical protein VE733_18630 [Streptosporangiaceae bacterium]|jgi:hypothetical protein|nr:hypothetical protein [Streptosporangiaceae bacterium]
MVIEVIEVLGDGSVRHAVVDTAGRGDAVRWARMVEQASLEVPPPYRPEPGQPVYEIRAGDQVAQIAEGDMVGPLRELVRAVLAASGGAG